MHLDVLLSEHPSFQRIQHTDNTFMDIQDWCVLAGYILNADKIAKNTLRIPRPADEDFKTVCRVLAATAPGRRPRCQAANIVDSFVGGARGYEHGGVGKGRTHTV